ncbi:hypothetical protein BT69DRAFT_1280637 [Atractiella rhizophila]|nr:hypothetical protein BT69DRAFT_1280637 [Atractiella rhizophila]
MSNRKISVDFSFLLPHSSTRSSYPQSNTHESPSHILLTRYFYYPWTTKNRTNLYFSTQKEDSCFPI